LPKGSVDDERASYTLYSNDQLTDASEYQHLVLTQKNGTPIVLSALGNVIEGVENTRLAGWANNKPAVLLIVFKQPDANVIETVDRIKAALPQAEKWIPPSVEDFAHQRPHHDDPVLGRGSAISLLLSVSLVVMVIFLFLRRFWPTFIASVTVPLSLAGTFAVMYCAATASIIFADGGDGLGRLRRG